MKQLFIAPLYKQYRDGAKDVLAKIAYLESIMPGPNVRALAITMYPSGTLLPILQKVGEALQEVNESIDVALPNSLSISGAHQSAFHLARNGTHTHQNFEKRQRMDGGIKSVEIIDLGEFRIGLVVDGEIVEESDFSLYRTKDDFQISS